VSNRIQSCYISAPPGENLSVLRDILTARGIRVVVPATSSVAVTGSDWAAEVELLVPEVDLVIGILTRERRSQWVLFELGQAWAKGKQVLLLASPSGTFVPSNLQRFLVVRASTLNREAISFAIDQLCAAPSAARRSEYRRAVEHSRLGPSYEAFLSQARVAVDSRNGEGLERIVAEALRKSGIDAVAERRDSDRGVDLAIWSDELQPLMGNPLLVEVKARLRTPNEARAALKQLSISTAASGTLWGVLLYGACLFEEQRLASLAPHNVLVLSVFHLLEHMETESFASIVGNLRNRRVHGASDARD
jgi:hypothetical protein